MGIASGVGLMSGLDTEAIIQATMNAERTPVLLLQQKQASHTAKISSYGSVKSALSNLSSAVDSLKDTENFEPSYSATSNDDDILTVTSSSTASGGSYDLVVSAIATSGQMTSNTYTTTTSSVGSGMLFFQIGDEEKESVEIALADNSLSSVATEINNADTDVLASVLKVGTDDYRLTLTAKSTGRSIDFTYQEAGFTFTTDSKRTSSSGETMKSEGFASDTTALGISGTLSVNGTDIALAGTETLNDIQASVDAIANTTASVELDADTGEYHLSVTHDTADSNVDLTYKDATSGSGFSALIDATKTQVAVDATIEINGIDVTRDDNEIDDLITGVTINLVEADATKTVSIEVAKSYSGTSVKLNAFVSAYNSVITTIEDLQAYNSDTGVAGDLLGDSTTNLLKSGLRRMLFGTVSGVESSINSLSNLGVTLEETGLLSYDSSTFTDAMATYESDITTFFTQTTSTNEGVAVEFDNLLDDYLQSTDGILATKEAGYNSSIDSITDDIESIERRLATKEKSLRAQYYNLEQLMAEFMSTSSYLTNQLSVLTNMTNKIYK